MISTSLSWNPTTKAEFGKTLAIKAFIIRSDILLRYTLTTRLGSHSYCHVKTCVATVSDVNYSVISVLQSKATNQTSHAFRTYIASDLGHLPATYSDSVKLFNTQGTVLDLSVLRSYDLLYLTRQNIDFEEILSRSLRRVWCDITVILLQF